MQLGQMRALGNPSTSNSISMLSSYFPGWKKSRLRKVSFQLLNLPLRPHPPTPTNPRGSEGHFCPTAETLEASEPALFSRLLCQLTVNSCVNILGKSPLYPPSLAWRIGKEGPWLLEIRRGGEIETFGFCVSSLCSFVLSFLFALQKSCGNFSKSTWQSS